MGWVTEVGKAQLPSQGDRPVPRFRRDTQEAPSRSCLLEDLLQEGLPIPNVLQDIGQDGNIKGIGRQKTSSVGLQGQESLITQT